MKETIITYLNNHIVGKEVTIQPMDELLSTGMLDSIGIMRLISFIEEEYSISVPPEEMIIENFEHVEAIVTFIGRRQAVESN